MNYASVIENDLGDDDCRKISYEVWYNGAHVATFRTEGEADKYITAQGWQRRTPFASL